MKQLKITQNYDSSKYGKLSPQDIQALKIKPEYAEMPIEGILRDADLAFGVVKEAGAITNPHTGKLQLLKTYSVFRDDESFKELGSGLSANYSAISYKDALEGVFGDLKTLGAIPARAISIDDGAKMAMQLILPEDYYAADLLHKQFANLYAGHDGKQQILVNSSDITIICQNTYAASKADKTMRFGAKHTLNLTNRLAEIRKVINLQSAEQQEFMKFLNGAALKNAELQRQQFVDFLLPPVEEDRSNQGRNNRRSELQEAIDTSARERNIAQITAHELFQGATRYITHRTQKRDDSEQFVYVMENDFPTKAKLWIAETFSL